MVTLDADFAVAADAGVAGALRTRGFAVEVLPHSKRAKDRADLIRLCETQPDAITCVPRGLIEGIDQLRAGRNQ
jgi:hypothetical protein